MKTMKIRLLDVDKLFLQELYENGDVVNILAPGDSWYYEEIGPNELGGCILSTQEYENEENTLWERVK